MITKLLCLVTAQKSLIAFILFIFSLSASAQNEFITTWKTDNPGTSNPTSITIPTAGPGYNYDVDWNNDGIFDEFGITGSVTHDFSSAGTYTIRIQGAFPGITFNCGGDKEKIISIDQWGTNPWSILYYAFCGCSNLVSTATDTPNLSGVTNLTNMFSQCSSFNGDLSSWDVSSVTNMASMFSGCSSFNSDLSSWDVSNVTDMSSMFILCSSFNADLSSWTVSIVTDMSTMFYGCSIFNSDLSAWNVNNVNSMSNMFNSCSIFNSNISAWNVIGVTDMSGMFSNALVFNGDLSFWDVSSVTNMSNMFLNAAEFNGELGFWNVGNVTDMSGMFWGASAFDGGLLINGWNVSNVTNMAFMFYDATAFQGYISPWDVSNVTNMSWMFYNTIASIGDIGGWDVSSVTDMSGMFYYSTVIYGDFSNWDISSVTNMANMFTLVTLPTTGYDNTLIGWSTLTGSETQIPGGVTFDGGFSTFCNSETERLSLINTYGWTITDGGKDCSGLGVEDYDLTSLKLYPNPTSNEFKIEGILENSVLEIYNLTGQLVKSENNYRGDLVDVTELSSAVYFVKISNPNGAGVKLLLID